MAEKPIIYGPDGRPIDRSLLTREIAGPTLAGVRSPLSGYPADGLNPRRLANILREADSGEPLRYFELAEQIEERDLHYAGVLSTRKRQVSQLDITVEAASDDAGSVAQADMVRAWLARDELADELFDMLDAVGKGLSFTEIIWDVSEGQWRPQRLEWRDPRWFRFDHVDGVTPLLRDVGGDQPLPGGKFVYARIKAKSGLPVRSGLARLAAWAWMFKAFTQRDWAIFTQTFGQPLRLGKYGAGASEEDKETLFRAVANIAGDCAAIVPESMAIEFVEAKNVSGSLDLYERRADWLDRQISKAVLGQTGTTDATPGKLGGSDDHTQVREDIERADARSLAAILNRDLVRVWIDLEFGPQRAYPRLKIGRPEERDVMQTVEAVEKLVPLGLRVQKSWMSDLLGIPDPDAGAELLGGPPAPPAGAGMPAAPGGPGGPQEGSPVSSPSRQAEGPSKAFYSFLRGLQAAEEGLAGAGAAAKPAVTPAELIAARLETEAQPSVEAWLGAIEAMLQAASSLEEFRAMLSAAFPQLDTAGLARPLAEGLLAAELAGRADVEGQSGA